MEQNYWLGRQQAAVANARSARNGMNRLIHFDLAGRYSIKAAVSGERAKAAPCSADDDQPRSSGSDGSGSRSTIERAFELARSGDYEGMPAIAARLKSEHLDSVDAHLAGPTIRKDLRRAWEAARRVAAQGAG